jgi:hypothetical protein
LFSRYPSAEQKAEKQMPRGLLRPGFASSSQWIGEKRLVYYYTHAFAGLVNFNPAQGIGKLIIDL